MRYVVTASMTRQGLATILKTSCGTRSPTLIITGKTIRLHRTRRCTRYANMQISSSSKERKYLCTVTQAPDGREPLSAVICLSRLKD